MTELERKLTTALRKLSAQFETEQRRHTEQVEALQQRVDQQTAQSETLQQRVETSRRQIEQLAGQIAGCDQSTTGHSGQHAWCLSLTIE